MEYTAHAQIIENYYTNLKYQEVLDFFEKHIEPLLIKML
jgi:hypothetical protein